MGTSVTAGDIFERYPRLDRVMFQVIGSGLVSICREMGTTMIRTAYSPIFVDGLDFSCGILDRHGQMVAQGEYSPVHLNSMTHAASWAVMEIGIANLEPGDVILHNDPYRGGTHLNDVNCIRPIFIDDELVAIAVNRAHHIDIGGKARAGFAGDAMDLFAEGLVIPPVKWWRAGVEDEDITEIFLRNVRQPYVQRADLSAQHSSCLTAQRRLEELCRKYGTREVGDCFEALMDWAELRMRAEIEAMPDGRYSFADFADDDGITTDPIRIECAVTVAGDELVVDFAGSNEQVLGPLNATYGITSSAVWNAIMQVTSDPTIPINAGRFRPVTFRLPRASILNAQDPRPTMGGNAELHIRICETVMGCFAQAMPEKVIAACYGCVNNFSGGGVDEETDDFWLYYLYCAGGWGARPNKDGWDEIYHQAGNALDYPVEILESQLPIRYVAKNMSEGHAGAGRFRGGFGARRTIRYLQPGEMNAVGERHKFGGWGLYGGRPAKPNAILLKRAGDPAPRPLTDFGPPSPSKFSNVPVRPGDEVTLLQSGGGGFGDPLERDVALVLRDVEDELISPADAESQYGVCIVADGYDYVVDEQRTLELRAERAGETHPYLIKECIAVDAAAFEEHRRQHPVAVQPHPEDTTIEAARASLDLDVCRTACPKQGDPLVCPFHNDEALDYWSAPNLHRWSKRHCPQKRALQPHFRVARIY
jgi:N-methylhydantoinase B/oxoprolinase/acetone carboxylase alpha subunit